MGGEDLEKKAEASRSDTSDAAPVPAENTVYKASVEQVRPIGLIVRLHNGRSAFVHSTQLSDYLYMSKDVSDEVKAERISGVASVGDTVFVKVLNVSCSDNGKVSVKASMKLADQRTGEDRDPTGRTQQGREHNSTDAEAGLAASRINSMAGTVASNGVINFAHELADVKQMDGLHRELVTEEEERAAEGYFQVAEEAIEGGEDTTKAHPSALETKQRKHRSKRHSWRNHSKSRSQEKRRDTRMDREQRHGRRRRRESEERSRSR